MGPRSLIGLAMMVIVEVDGRTVGAQPTVDPCAAQPSRMKVVADPLLPNSIAGRIVRLDDGRPVVYGLATATGPVQRSTRTDSSGGFRLDSLPEGRYGLHLRGIGLGQAVDSVAVTARAGIAAEGRLSATTILWIVDCRYEQRLAGPRLVLAGPESLSVQRTLPDGTMLRHTLVATTTKGQLLFHSRIVNIGATPTVVTRICGSGADGPLFVQPEMYIGVGCGPEDQRLPPGDSIVAVSGGPVRGRPGRYQYRVAPIHPPALGATITLRLVAPDSLPR